MHRALVVIIAIICSAPNAQAWIRGGDDGTEPRWGIAGGLQFSIHPATRGPRGLIRIHAPTLPDGKYDLVNFIAVEPIVAGRRGLSELEHSKLDGRDGKRFWVEPGEMKGSIERRGEVEVLRVVVQVEKFDNGADVKLIIEQRSDQPDEIALMAVASAGSAPLEHCILTATMGNKARARVLWLKDRTIDSKSLYPDYTGPDFTPHTSFSRDEMAANAAGDLIAAITTDEEKPAEVKPFAPTTRWYWGGEKVTQYWKMPRGAWSDDVKVIVNGRYTYWRSQKPIPGGIAFENFELRDTFHANQPFIFGVTRKLPAELGLRSRSPATTPITREQVDAIVRSRVGDRLMPALVIGIIDASGRQIFAYGTVGDRAPDSKTLFEIGSITKVFTSVLLADMAATCEVQLDAKVQGLLPAYVTIPLTDGGDMTLTDLATHRSGLPRLPPNFDRPDPGNPYARYTREMLFDGLEMIRPPRERGTFYYSNLAVGLLGQLLADRAGRSWEELIVQRICQPLGMNDTRMTLDEDQHARLAVGSDWWGLAAPNWDFDALAGAGGLRSNVDDLLTFAAANAGLTSTPLDSVLRMTHEVRAPAEEDYDIALGWHVTKKHGIRYHGGTTAGYRAFIAFAPEQKIGLVVLSNASYPAAHEIGYDLCRAIVGQTPAAHGRAAPKIEK